MRVYDGDSPEHVVFDDLEGASDDSIDLADIAELLESAHEEARWTIAECDSAAASIKAGTYPEWLARMAQTANENALDCEEPAPKWAQEVTGAAKS